MKCKRSQSNPRLGVSMLMRRVEGDLPKAGSLGRAIVLCMFLMSATGLHAQWTQLNSGTGEILWGVGAISGEQSGVYAVGNSGTILRSDDNGDNWYAENSPYSGTLNGISRDGMYIAADGGHILVNFSPWLDCTTGTTRPILCLQPLCYEVAVGAHGTILTTYESMTSWTTAISHTTRDLYGVIDDRSNYWSVAVGASGAVVRTTDWGQTWSAVTSSTTNYLFAVCRTPGSNVVVAVGQYGTIIRSTDLGATWSTAESGTGEDLYGVCDCGGNPDTLTAVGTGGTILNSDDHGTTWQSDNSPTPSQLNWVNCMGGGTPTFIVGVDGMILRRAPLSPTGIEERRKTAEREVRLKVRPDPSDGPMVISYSIPADGEALITVTDVSGRTVRRLVDGELNAGDHSLRWNGADDNGRLLPKGVYFCELRTRGLAVMRKVVIVE